MPALHLKDIPDDLYQQIEQLAAADHMSLDEETLILLRRAVSSSPASSRSNVTAILLELRRNQIVPLPGAPDSVETLREGRER